MSKSTGLDWDERLKCGVDSRGHIALLGPIAHRAPAAADLGRSPTAPPLPGAAPAIAALDTYSLCKETTS
jgi:hypothetical protein